MDSRNVSPVGLDGKVRCFHHKREATLRTSHGVTNSNRQFYACSLPEGEQCGFFFWKDRLPKSETSYYLNQTQAQQTPSSKLPTKSNRFPPIITPTSPAIGVKPQHSPWPVSPSKRSSPYNNNEARQKRFKAIQDALSSSPQPNATNVDSSRHNTLATTTGPSGPATTQSPRASRLAQSIREAFRTPQSPAHTSTSSVTAESSTVYAPNSTPPGPLTYELSDLGFDLSRRRPFTGQNMPSLQPLEMESISMFGNDDDDPKSEDELWDTVSGPSPASSVGEVAKSLLQRDDKGKGKQKAEDTGSEDGLNWFMDIPPTETSRPGLFPKIPAGPASELSGDNIQDIIDWLSDVPGYVRKLERKLAAMEKSNAIKAERIRELEEDVQELKSPKRGTPAASR